MLSQQRPDLGYNDHPPLPVYDALLLWQEIPIDETDQIHLLHCIAEDLHLFQPCPEAQNWRSSDELVSQVQNRNQSKSRFQLLSEIRLNKENVFTLMSSAVHFGAQVLAKRCVQLSTTPSQQAEDSSADLGAYWQVTENYAASSAAGNLGIAVLPVSKLENGLGHVMWLPAAHSTPRGVPLGEAAASVDLPSNQQRMTANDIHLLIRQEDSVDSTVGKGIVITLMACATHTIDVHTHATGDEEEDAMYRVYCARLDPVSILSQPAILEISTRADGVGTVIGRCALPVDSESEGLVLAIAWKKKHSSMLSPSSGDVHILHTLPLPGEVCNEFLLLQLSYTQAGSVSAKVEAALPWKNFVQRYPEYYETNQPHLNVESVPLWMKYIIYTVLWIVLAIVMMYLAQSVIAFIDVIKQDNILNNDMPGMVDHTAIAESKDSTSIDMEIICVPTSQSIKVFFGILSDEPSSNGSISSLVPVVLSNTGATSLVRGMLASWIAVAHHLVHDIKETMAIILRKLIPQVIVDKAVEVLYQMQYVSAMLVITLKGKELWKRVTQKTVSALHRLKNRA